MIISPKGICVTQKGQVICLKFFIITPRVELRYIKCAVTYMQQLHHDSELESKQS